MARRLLLVLGAMMMLGACSIFATPEEQDAYRAAHPESVRHRDERAAAPVSEPAPAPTPPRVVASATPAPPPPAISNTAPPPAMSSAAPPLPPQPSVASNVSVATPTPRPADNGEVVVSGVLPRQVPPPSGDPRSTQERMADIRAWDSCVLHLQARSTSDPMRPQLEEPEDICRRQLGMVSRTAVPDSRKPR